ncbi:hypothetical protein AM1_2140 [Acaryochloris marina MBIC11017]|uniref:Uncharacterized protein n=1 Tax=Acaryochloris marina (strain MBIC 11017) TaxID=329726 RepID=B0BZU5_ACAM1|nr:hypothetical protein AM1_2140 [Acaryochloris marina MBIC11017]
MSHICDWQFPIEKFIVDFYFKGLKLTIDIQGHPTKRKLHQ